MEEELFCPTSIIVTLLVFFDLGVCKFLGVFGVLGVLGALGVFAALGVLGVWGFLGVLFEGVLMAESIIISGPDGFIGVRLCPVSKNSSVVDIPSVSNTVMSSSWDVDDVTVVDDDSAIISGKSSSSLLAS